MQESAYIIFLCSGASAKRGILLSQLTEAQFLLTASQNQTKQSLLQGIQIGLQLKFGSQALEILGEISAIDDVNLLQTIASSLLTVEGLEDFRQIYLS